MNDVPLVRFLIAGVQKCGTTALASYLREHPGLVLPTDKEAHVFDDPDFDERWDSERIDQGYRRHFPPSVAPNVLHGDATPIYIFHPRLVARIARYNPDMRWIVLLRDPVRRAYSQYHMERARGDERLPFWLALLLEPLRLYRHRDDFRTASPLRHHSYFRRGCYDRQIAVLHRHVPPEQVLVLRSDDLDRAPDATLARVYRFLGVAAPEPPPTPRRVFVGPKPAPQRSLLAWCLRQCYRPSLARLQRRFGISLD